jgi:hypothetical protein
MVLKLIEDVKILRRDKNCLKFHLSKLSTMPVEFSLPFPQGSITKLKGIPSMGAHSSACSAVTHSLSYSEAVSAGLPNKTSPLRSSAMAPNSVTTTSVSPYGLNTVVYKKKPSLSASVVNCCLPLIGAKISPFFSHTLALR